jgi:hypothetical protein
MMHHIQVPSAAQYLPEDYLRRVTMPPGCFASHDFSHALLPRGDKLRMDSWRNFLELRQGEVRRTLLLGNSVNKGSERKRQCC